MRSNGLSGVETDKRGRVVVSQAIGPYRIVIDGVMILTLLSVAWGIRGWVAGVESSVGEAKAEITAVKNEVAEVTESQEAVVARLSSYPPSGSQAISREADRRIAVVEKQLEANYREIDRRLARIERKLDIDM